MHPNYRGMAFLLSLGTLPIGCNKDDDETTGISVGPITTQPGTNSDPMGSTSELTGTGDNPTTADPSSDSVNDTTTGPDPTTNTTNTTNNTTNNSNSGPMTGDPTGDPATSDADPTDPQMTTFVTGNTDDTGFPESESGGENQVCLSYGDKVSECFQRDPGMAAADCQYYLDTGLQMDGPGCAQAFEQFYACLSQLDCASFEMSVGCDPENMAIPQACPSLP